jgi:hypothetical protein
MQQGFFAVQRLVMIALVLVKKIESPCGTCRGQGVVRKQKLYTS